MTKDWLIELAKPDDPIYSRGLATFSKMGNGGRALREEENEINHDILQFARALSFAAQKHTAQRRKGEAAEPYINHLAEVSMFLAEVTEGSDPKLIIAGLLHDTLEDTETTFAELEKNFGTDVASLVKEVTDDKSLPKAERKRLQIETAPKKSKRAQMIKIADKISNLLAIMSSPPVDWSDERKREYFDWAKKVVDGCRGCNPPLEGVFDKTWEAGI